MNEEIVTMAYQLRREMSGMIWVGVVEHLGAMLWWPGEGGLFGSQPQILRQPFGFRFIGLGDLVLTGKA